MAQQAVLSVAIPGVDKRKSIWSAVFVNLLIVNFFQAFGQMMMNTIVPLYSYSLGASASAVGFVTSSFAITALAIRPFSGPAFDSFSKKWLLVIAIAINFTSTFLYGIVSTVPGLIAVRLFHGCGIGCAMPLALSMVSDDLPPEKMGSGISFFSLAGTVAQVVGPAFGIWLSGVVGYNNVFFLASAMLGAALVMCFFVKEPGSHVRKPYKITPSRIFAKQTVIPTTLIGILQIAFTCVSGFIAIYGKLRGIDSIGLYFTVYAICLLATRPLFGKLADRIGFSKVIIPGLVIFGCSFFLISQATTLYGFLLAAVVGACGYGVCSPLIQATCMQCVPSSARGAGSNTYFTGLDVGTLVGPIVGGFVIERITEMTGSEVGAYGDMYLFMLIPIAAGLVYYIFTRKRLAALTSAARKQNEAELAAARKKAAEAAA